MITLIANNNEQLAKICRRHHVKRLDLFGSATTDNFNPDDSDLDFLVDYLPLSPAKHADAYFGLLQDLQTLFNCEIDLIEDKAIQNPYFRQTVDQTRQPIYGN